MKHEKLLKYMNGNFELKESHIYAVNKLNKIKNKLLKKYNIQYGGTIEEDKNILENQIKNNTDLKTIISNIREKAEKNGVMIDKTIFEKLMSIDNDLVEKFNEFIDMLKSEEHKPLRDTLISIQKGFFELQVKIIFSELKKIEQHMKPIDILPLFEAISNKIQTMNAYIDKKEEYIPKEIEKKGFYISEQLGPKVHNTNNNYYPNSSSLLVNNSNKIEPTRYYNPNSSNLLINKAKKD